MVWQDIMITAASIVFFVALLPQVYHGFKEKRGVVKLATSAPTFVGLYVIAGTYASLQLYFSAIISVIVGTLWLLLFIQGLKYGKS